MPTLKLLQRARDSRRHLLKWDLRILRFNIPMFPAASPTSRISDLSAVRSIMIFLAIVGIILAHSRDVFRS